MNIKSLRNRAAFTGSLAATTAVGAINSMMSVAVVHLKMSENTHPLAVLSPMLIMMACAISTTVFISNVLEYIDVIIGRQTRLTDEEEAPS